MTLSIFCPNNHLILDAPRCQECNWERPLPGNIGEPVWVPIVLGAGLGGPGRGVFSRSGTAQGIVVFPSREGELIGIGLIDGQLRWRKPLDSGRKTRALVPIENRLLAAISDERSLGEAGNGYLVAVDPNSGELSTLWEADGHQVSAPVLVGDQILIRTSTSALLALSREGQPQILWRRPLDAWWAQSPFVAGDNIIVTDGRPMHGEGYLKAFDLADGTLRWKIPTDGLLSQPPTATGSRLVFRNGRRQLVGLDLGGGEKLWERDYKRIYSPPVAGGELIFVSVRGPAPLGEEGHYLLQALESANGELAWEIPLPARARTLRWGENAIFAGSDHGHVMAYHPSNGKTIWAYTLGSDEDPIRTELVIANDLLNAGTYAGKVVAIRIAAPRQELESPEEYLERDEFENAAAAFTLLEDFHQAADLYAQQLNETEKSYAIYDHAKLFREAGELARSVGEHEKAQYYFGLIGDLIAQAEIDLEMGHLLEAARKFDQAGELSRAAQVYEQEEVKEYRKALDRYIQLGQMKDILRLRLKTPLTLTQIEWLEQQGRLKEAAEEAVRIGEFRKAADLYNQISAEEEELAALTQFVRSDPEEFALLRIAEISRSMGKFHQEAQAWERLGKPKRTADAYCRAAMQAEQRTPEDSPRIAGFYDRAAYYFAEADMPGDVAQCRDNVARYHKLPIVLIDGRTNKEFKEFGWNELELTVRNKGYGIAEQVHWKVRADRFDFDETTGIWLLRRLGEDREETVILRLRPKKGEYGDAVPFALEWYWKDREGREFEDRISISIVVKSKDDSRPTDQPMIFQGGTLIQTEKYVAGDELASGAEKGVDKVIINRGSGGSLSASDDRVETRPGEEKPTLICPNCALPNDADASFCNYCNFELSVPKTGNKSKT